MQIWAWEQEGQVDPSWEFQDLGSRELYHNTARFAETGLPENTMVPPLVMDVKGFSGDPSEKTTCTRAGL